MIRPKLVWLVQCTIYSNYSLQEAFPDLDCLSASKDTTLWYYSSLAYYLYRWYPVHVRSSIGLCTDDHNVRLKKKIQKRKDATMQPFPSASLLARSHALTNSLKTESNPIAGTQFYLVIWLPEVVRQAIVTGHTLFPKCCRGNHTGLRACHFKNIGTTCKIAERTHWSVLIAKNGN